VYDDVCNSTSSHLSAAYSYEPNKFNRLTATSSTGHIYDVNGNMATKTGGGNLWQYTGTMRTALSRLRRAHKPQATNTTLSADA
jgi:hypothetical protein